jgi:hypothetical protein
MSRFAFAVLPLLVGCAPYEVLDPTASYAGKTLGQRSADWWTWVYETPFTGHPLVDETGSDCATNQPSDVFYLGGTFGGDASRTCTVPKGVPVLVPLVNYSFDNCGVPEEFVVPEEQFGPEIDAFLDSVTGLTLTVDGDALGSTAADFSAHRVDLTSYDYTVPAEDSLYAYFGLDYSGPCGPATSGGYYALIDLAARRARALVLGDDP